MDQLPATTEAQGAGPNAEGAAYQTYDIQNRVKSVEVVLRLPASNVADYKRTEELCQATKAACIERSLLPRAMNKPEGTQNTVVISRPELDALLHPSYNAAFVEVGLTAGGMASGAIISENSARHIKDLAALINETVAAHVLYNADFGTDHRVQYEPSAVRYDFARLKGAARGAGGQMRG